jgi:hypothetical protein
MAYFSSLTAGNMLQQFVKPLAERTPHRSCRRHVVMATGNDTGRLLNSQKLESVELVATSATASNTCATAWVLECRLKMQDTLRREKAMLMSENNKLGRLKHQVMQLPLSVFEKALACKLHWAGNHE